MFRGRRHNGKGAFPMAILYALIGTAIGIYLGFLLFGYDTPYEADPNFNAPMLTDYFLGFVLMLIIGSIGVVVWSVVSTQKGQRKSVVTENSIRAARLVYGVAAFTAVVMLLTFAVGSSDTIIINGKPFADSMPLRLADMFVASAMVMIVVAFGAIGFGYMNRRRQRNGGK